MENVKNLNEIIEKELMLKQLDGGQKLKKLLVTAEGLYKIVCNVSAKNQDSENNNVILPEEVILLRDNIERIKEELLGLGINTQGKSR